MTRLIRIWLGASHHAAFRCGGWAFVRQVGGEVSGVAGGERYVTAARIALAGLVAALRDLPAGADGEIVVETTSAALAAADVSAEPEEDCDLWLKVRAAVGARRLVVRRIEAAPKTPAAFAAAWAELARDKAKATGPFSAAIPKTNLAKVQGLAA